MTAWKKQVLSNHKLCAIESESTIWKDQAIIWTLATASYLPNLIPLFSSCNLSLILFPGFVLNVSHFSISQNCIVKNKTKQVSKSILMCYKDSFTNMWPCICISLCSSSILSSPSPFPHNSPFFFKSPYLHIIYNSATEDYLEPLQVLNIILHWTLFSLALPRKPFSPIPLHFHPWYSLKPCY